MTNPDHAYPPLWQAFFPFYYNPCDNATWPVKRASVGRIHWLKKKTFSTRSSGALIIQIAHQLHCYSLSSDNFFFFFLMLGLLNMNAVKPKVSYKYGWGSWLLRSSHSQELWRGGSEAVQGHGKCTVWSQETGFYTSFATLGDREYFPLAFLSFSFFIGKNEDMLLVFQARFL